MNCCNTHGFVTLLPSAHYTFPSTRKIVDVIQVIKGDSRNSNVKKALLAAKKKERVKLPNYANARDSGTSHISDFFKHPMGIEAMLNVNALEYYIPLDANTYRCRLPPVQLLNFEVAPVLDLQVNSITEGCTVELLSCKFEGSEIVESQNKYFTASMKNLIRWGDDGKESFLDVDVRLLISLEIYNRPFNLLPVSAVEGPGNLVVQALLDRYVPLLSQQLLRDYDVWVKQQSKTLP
ncbi:uncharacterized protein LOC141600117 isoform X2 [Silene latifolia]|uniref:uncharacterized protein LOC141600117 isoform X2 n=1 Tax=Silene latifolia TaxID=37657 RepID=UPI003D7727F7